MKKLNNKAMASLLLGFALLIGIGLTVSTTVSAQGRNGNNRSWDDYPNWGGSFDLRQTALNAGYNEGQAQGQKDASRNRQSDPEKFSSYQKANRDYNSRLGDQDLYSRYFRAGFLNGYNGAVGLPLAYSKGHGNDNGNWNGNNGNGNNNNNNNDSGGWNNGRWTGSNNNGTWNNNNGAWVNRGRNWDGYPNWGGSFQLRQTALNAGYNEGIKQGRSDRNRRSDYDLNRFSAYRNADKDYNKRDGDLELYRRYYREAFQNGYEAGVNGN